MSITKESELEGMKTISEIVALTLKEMCKYVKPGMSAKEVDDFGGCILRDYGAKSAPKLTYNFPGFTCISINHEIAHGIPAMKKVFHEGDLINIDVSAELKGFWSDNGSSFVLGEDQHKHMALVDGSKEILMIAIQEIKHNVRISDVGRIIQKEARNRGFNVIKNLAGHGIGRNLHEYPHEILNYYDPNNYIRFKKNSVVAVETFISTDSSYAVQQSDGWTLVGNKGGYVAQHEHTIMVTEDKPLVLTALNGIWS